MERQSDEIQGRVETLEHGSETTADRQRRALRGPRCTHPGTRKQYECARFRRRNGRWHAVTSGNCPLPGGSDRDNYQAAFELLKEERYEPAAMAFQQFLVTYPDSELADNAQYWARRVALRHAKVR